MVEVEEVRNYYRFWINTLAQEVRRCGVSCPDKEFAFPAMRSLEKVLDEVGVDGFFDEGCVVGYGLSLDGCVAHTKEMKSYRESYARYQDCWEGVCGG